MNGFYCPALTNTDVKYIKGVGPARAAMLNKLGVHTAADLLELYPRAYMDFSKGRGFTAFSPGESCCVKAVVLSEPFRIPTRNRNIVIYRLRVIDCDGVVGNVVFFNSEYSAELLKTGSEYGFIGRFEHSQNGYEINSPRFMPTDNVTALLAPVYPLTKGLTGNVISKIVKEVIAKYLPSLADPMPPEIRQEYGLCDLQYAYRNIHFPTDEAALGTARERLIFDELLLFDLVMLSAKKSDREGRANVIPPCDMKPFYSALPFSLTQGQKTAVEEACADMEKSRPMSRLLQGDVGSGKTAVCAALIYKAVTGGFQAALMAPTELLANQHHRTLSALLSPLGINVALLTGSTTAAKRTQILSDLADGSAAVAVGTHALFSEGVEFKNLALVVTDEQHRFGVRQRSKLASKGESPHFYVMSATPIPRTLALMIYGDLDISRLDTLPGGRRSIDTYIYRDKDRTRLFGFIKKELDAGRQAYIVCPAIEENETGRLAAVTYYENFIQPAFADYTTALLHGKLAAKSKDAVMKSFVSGKTALLVSTTVIEVGIDVPNATVMVIENADCFGLAQLHQLRGRVGRGEFQSYCVLVAQRASNNAIERLRILKNSSDGFEIAEKDLAQRGPGDFIGERQSGLPMLKLAGNISEFSAISAAKNAAEKLFASLPRSYQLLIGSVVGDIAKGGLN